MIERLSCTVPPQYIGRLDPLDMVITWFDDWQKPTAEPVPAGFGRLQQKKETRLFWVF